jgi:hypothetical protein
MENNLPLGTPKYNQDLTCFNLDCSEDIEISCNETDCRMIDIKKNGALILTLLAASVLVCVKNDDSDCAPCLVKDYRQANNSAPYVELQGYSSECESKFFKIETLSIFPKQGQDSQALKDEVIEAICACLNPAPPAPPEPPVVGYNIQTGVEFMTQNTWGMNSVYGILFEWFEGGISPNLVGAPPFPAGLDALIDYEYQAINPAQGFIKPQSKMTGVITGGNAITLEVYIITGVAPTVGVVPNGTKNRLYLYYTKV